MTSLAACFSLLGLLAFSGMLIGCKPPPPPKQATLKVISVPDRANVLLNGVAAGVTPIAVPIDHGEHMVEIGLDGHETVWRKVPAEVSGEHEIRVNLQATTSTIQFSSVPAGATVRLNGQDVGKTPFVTPGIELGEHTAEFRLSGSGTRAVRFRVDSARPTRIQAMLTSILGTVSIRSTPGGASIYIDEQFRGTTPLQLNDVPEGKHEIVAKLAGHAELVHPFVITPNEIKTVRLPAFKALPGRLKVNTIPRGASVYRGEELLGMTPLEVEVREMGTLNLRIQMTGYEPVFREVTIRPGAESNVNVQLDANFGGLALTTEPPGCQIYVDDKKIGVTEQVGNEFVSAVFEHNGLDEGPHTVRVVHQAYIPAKRKIIVLRNQLTQVGNIKLKKRWLPDTELKKTSGEVLKGILLEKNKDGSILFEPEKGIKILYQPDQYEYVRPLLQKK